MDIRAAARLAWTAGALALLLGAGAVGLRVFDAGPATAAPWWLYAMAVVVAFGIAGALIVARHPANPIGWMLLVVGVAEALAAVADQYAVAALVRTPTLPGGVVALWLATWTWPALGLLLAVFLLFPDGRLPSPGWRPVLVLVLVLPLASMVGLAISPGRLASVPWPAGLPAPVNPFGVQAAGPLLRLAALSLFVLLPAAMLVCVGALWWRLRRASGDERQQLQWVSAGAVLLMAAWLFPAAGGPERYAPVVGAVALMLFAAALGVAILKYRLYDLDLLVNRTLVWGALTACVVAGYVGTVALLGALVQRRGQLVVSLVATGLVAVAFTPLRLGLQRAVDRLVYGERGDLNAVIAHLGERLQEAPAAQVLPVLVETVARTLKLPYVAVELRRGDGLEPAASYGRSVAEPLWLALAHQGQAVGRLAVGPRSPREGFSRTDRRLFDGLARQVEVVAYAVRLAADLQASRQRLVAAREEERRRLRRDLHDGLGAVLAGAAMQLGAARNLLRADADAADALLAKLSEEVQAAVAEVRRLVYDLRPPALDEFGLVAAIRQQAARFASGAGHGPLEVVVEACGRLDGLPAAVEVAAYRIATEALTNVARHADARCCTVRISCDGALELEVADDGCGLPDGRMPGVGLASIRERAAELGGACTIGRGPDGGTLVRAWLPLPETTP